MATGLILAFVLALPLAATAADDLDDEGLYAFDVDEDEDFGLGDDPAPAKGKKGKGKAADQGPQDDEDLEAEPEWDVESDLDDLDTEPEPDLGRDDPDEGLDTDLVLADVQKDRPARTKAPDIAPERASKPGPPAARTSGLGLDVANREPLADNFPVEIVSKDLDSVVVELPVLVARQGDDTEPGSFWVVAEVYSDKQKVGETRSFVSPASLADMGPTVMWVKTHVPVHMPQGTVAVTVSREDETGARKELFTRAARYQL